MVVNSELWWVNSQGEYITTEGRAPKSWHQRGEKATSFPILTPGREPSEQQNHKQISLPGTEGQSRRGPVSGAGRAAALLAQPPARLLSGHPLQRVGREEALGVRVLRLRKPGDGGLRRGRSSFPLPPRLKMVSRVSAPRF